MIKRVHVVFKTHLDIGFTDLASRTIDRYFDQFIPNAIECATLLRQRGKEERLVWTTGSWLINSYLAKKEGPEAQKLVEAIRLGDITYHALPFTTHTELMDSNLLHYGLSLSKQLDRRFNHETIAAKMTDVPGHTLAMVPHLAKAGIQFLHLGVNGGSPLPKVPRLFVWRAPGKEEVIVQYDASYGSQEPIGSLEDLLGIENSADNCGPPSQDQVLSVWDRLRRQYPDAEILASSLDAYARSILPFKKDLPVVTEEIGDTWIHGVGSDPYKVSAFKALNRLAQRWKERGLLDIEHAFFDTFFDNLLMVSEHTWGLDFKKYLADYKNWSVEDFHRARKADIITSDAVPPAYHFIEEFAKAEYAHVFGSQDTRRDLRTYSFFSSAHQEQRDYLSKAIASLPPSLQTEAQSELRKLEIEPFHADDDQTLLVGRVYTIGLHHIAFNNDGSLAHLIDERDHDLVKGEGLGVYRYETFSAEDYLQFHHQYNRNYDLGKDWISADFGKPGMEAVYPPVQHRLYRPEVSKIYLKRESGGFSAIVLLDAEKESPRGAPKNLILRYRFSAAGSLESICLDWMNKEATRLPQAMWLGVSVQPRALGSWRMQKLGYNLALDTTVENGSRSLHAIEQLTYEGEQTLTIKNLDSPLVSLDERKLLRFDNVMPRANGVFQFNLLNNIWNTNFPLWYEQDGRSRLVFTYD